MGCCRRASSTPTSTRSRAAWSGCAATSRSCRPARSTSTTIKAYADANPDLEWILGGGWGMPAFPGGNPTAADLDAVVPGRPVFLPNRDHHGAWVSSRALEIAGIDRDTPDPPDGRIERDADGNPSGSLHEGATSLVSRHLPRTTGEDYYAALMAGQAYLHSLGVTGWQDAIVGAYSGMDDPASTYTTAAANGDLRSHVVGALWWERRLGVEQVADLVGRRETMTGGRFRATSVKIMQDGVAENGTAAMLEPYLDRCGHATDNRGHSFIEAGALRAAVAALDSAGFQVHVHAIGDRGMREALDAFEGTRPRATAPHRAPAADPPRRRAALRRPRGGGQHAGAVGLSRRADDRPDAAVPGAGAIDLAVPLRRAAPHRRPARRRQRLAGLERPTRWPRSTRRSPARRTASPAGRGPSRSSPSRRCPWRPPSRRTPPARRGSTAATASTAPGSSRRAPPPTWSCSTATPSPVRPRRSARPP